MNLKALLIVASLGLSASAGLVSCASETPPTPPAATGAATPVVKPDAMAKPDAATKDKTAKPDAMAKPAATAKEQIAKPDAVKPDSMAKPDATKKPQ